MKLTKYLYSILTAVFIVNCFSFMAYAEPIVQDEVTKYELQINVNTDNAAYYSDVLDVIFIKDDGSNYHDVKDTQKWYAKAPIGYSAYRGDGWTSYLEEGKYAIIAVSEDDPDGRFIIDSPKEVIIPDTKEININVTDSNPNTLKEHVVESIPEIEPAEYDFSEGKECGTVNVSTIIHYGSFNNITFTLIGEKPYEIPLDAEHGFRATVKLPVGRYRESNNIKADYVNGVDVDWLDTLAWEHIDDVSHFGKSYEVNANSEVDINDLTLMYSKDGYYQEYEDDLLTEKEAREHLENVDQQIDKAIESAYGSGAEENNENQEIENNKSLKYIVLIIVSFIVVIGLVYLVKKIANHIDKSRRLNE